MHRVLIFWVFKSLSRNVATKTCERIEIHIFRFSLRIASSISSLFI